MSATTRGSLYGRILGAVGLLLCTALPASAQQGTISGEVVDRTTRQPINGAQVTIEGTTRGVSSDARGRFLIPGVAAGTHSLRVQYIGYRTETQEVTVTAGETASVRFELGISAVALDEVVVTGTGGATERRQLGASVASVDVARVQEAVPVADIGSVLQARVPGVRSVGTTGGAGAGRDLRIRGMTSTRLDQQPVIYIDGVKVDGTQAEWAQMGSSCCSFSGGAGVDRLADLNPADIERIEIIRGAAAGTLYGTEAANGVIQIFTKRGRSDSAPRWSFDVTQGATRMRPNAQTKLYPNFTGPDGFRAWDANQTLIETGHYQSYNATVQGGGSSVTYFASGGYLSNEGSIKPNVQERSSLRLNLSWLSSERLSFDLTSSFSHNRADLLQSGNNWTSLLGNAVLGNPRRATPETPYGEPWVSVEAIKQIETVNNTNRWTGGLATTYNATPWFTNRLQVGLDVVNEEQSMWRPWGQPYVYVPEGEKNLGFGNRSNYTMDYLGTVDLNQVGLLRDNMSGRLSFGTNGNWEFVRRNMATGRDYAGPGVSTVTGGTTTFGQENFQESIQLGGFGQARIGFVDRLFLTLGGRVDGNSAFGENFGTQFYPNAQVSYALNEAAFVPDFISNLRVRGAIGRAGKAPGAFDKFQTFTPFTALEDEAAIRAFNIGNADLRPERTTEYEVGFESGLWNDRIGFDVTLYRTFTVDALLPVTLPPSAHVGFPGAAGQPLRNIGEVENSGWEVAVRLTPVESRTLRWSTDLSFDGNRNEVTSLGMDAGHRSAAQRRPARRLPGGLAVRIPHDRFQPGNDLPRADGHHGVLGSAAADVQCIVGERPDVRRVPRAHAGFGREGRVLQQQRPSVPHVAACAATSTCARWTPRVTYVCADGLADQLLLATRLDREARPHPDP
jgi:TonB-dependent starch-binding outer membrane protein SusC